MVTGSQESSVEPLRLYRFLGVKSCLDREMCPKRPGASSGIATETLQFIQVMAAPPTQEHS